jgi:hypothetical protein
MACTNKNRGFYKMSGKYLPNSVKLSNIVLRRWSDLKFKEKMSTIIKKRQNNQEYKKMMSERQNKKLLSQLSIQKWKDPNYRQKAIEAKQLKTYRNNMSLKSRLKWKDENYRIRMSMINSNTMKNLWSKLDYRQKMCLRSKLKWSDKQFREKMAKLRLSQPKTSSQQRILYSLLDDLKIKYYKDTDPQCMIGYYCFDCRINPQDSLSIKKSLLIEVQGDYWHSLPKSINKDKSKATYLRTYFPEFDLKYLWEHEFNNKDRITNLLRYWLGLDNPKLVEFKFKEITKKIIDHKDAELFISKYHYAGRIGRSGLNIGYFIKDELIAVIIYVSPTRQETALKQGYLYKEVLELSRLAIHPQYQVKNLASFILSKSIKIIKSINTIKCLVSFADLTYNHSGTIYKASNWIPDGEVQPDYWYADDKGYICHKKTLWNHAKKMNMTENEYCEKYGYHKVYGDKKYRYRMEINSASSSTN